MVNRFDSVLRNCDLILTVSNRSGFSAIPCALSCVLEQIHPAYSTQLLVGQSSTCWTFQQEKDRLPLSKNGQPSQSCQKPLGLVKCLGDPVCFRASCAGTTTATVLTRAIFAEGAKSVAAGMNPMDLRRGINIATQAVVEELKKQSTSISTTEEIAQVFIAA